MIVTATEQNIEFDRWFDRFFASYLSQHPVDATMLGSHEYDDELPDYSLAADTDRATTARDLIATLDALPFDRATEDRVCDRILARSFLELQQWEARTPFFQAGNPSYHLTEALLGIVTSFEREHESLTEQVDAAMRRMEQLPAFLATARSRVNAAPLNWTERALQQTETAIVWFGEGIRSLAADRGIDRPDFFYRTDLAKQAFAEHHHWLREHLAERRIAFRPAGIEAFDLLLRHGHLLPAEQTTEWWFDYAHAEFVETTQELKDLARTIDWKRSWKQQLADLPNDHPTPENYYRTFDEISDRVRTVANDLVSWPETMVEFRPALQSDWHLAEVFDRSPFRGRSPLGRDLVDQVFIPACDPNMSLSEQQQVLWRMNHTQITLDTVIRQAGLGRHVQHDRALRSRSRIGRIAGVGSVTRPTMFCSGTLVQGWMAYAAELMEEIGVLTPLQQLAEARHRMHLAARAVVDIAIHSGEFGIGRAARLLRDEVGLPASVAMQTAIDHSLFPGTGIAGLIGVAAIDELRRQIEDQEGSDFSLKSFHDRLLSYGAIPTTLIAASMLAPAESSIE